MEAVTLCTAEKNPEFVEQTLRTQITEFNRRSSMKDI
jgi:hypothetical protein